MKAEKSGLKDNWFVKIEGALNGIIVKACSEGDESEYVYKTLKEALKELPGIVSILKDEPKQVTEEDLDKEEARIEEDE
jgi:hypothetical protein